MPVSLSQFMANSQAFEAKLKTAAGGGTVQTMAFEEHQNM